MLNRIHIALAVAIAAVTVVLFTADSESASPQASCVSSPSGACLKLIMSSARL